MSETTDIGESRRRARRIALSGGIIILLGGGAALLPAIEWARGSALIGSLLLAGGLVELYAGAFRRPVQKLAMLAGAVTGLAGLLFLLRPIVQFTPVIYIIIAWLVLRSTILLLASPSSIPSVRLWMIVSAATDLVLALLLLAGLSIATLVVLLFGPTPQFIASFAWVLALSFLATGLLLINVASCERQSAGQ